MLFQRPLPFRKLMLLAALVLFSHCIQAEIPQKRQFRGAWVHTVGQSKYATMPQAEMKKYFSFLLDSLQEVGINAVLFQVRPEADAWYQSKYEPWSRFITGTQGKDPGWDPLAFMVEACHQRNMEIHAWLNPYRARSTNAKPFSANHIYNKHPDWFIIYGDLTWFDPGNPECRSFIKMVVRDLVKNYDIDAVHMDDYFYPYPVAGKEFNDSKSFRTYGFAMGFTESQKAAWRRENVNMLIRDLYKVIHDEKPWVQFGVSPFGIWRNKKTDPNGSQTNGLTNYDDLYADVLTWLEKGWVDYNIPQLYWEIGHKNAEYVTLLKWWAERSYGKALYIGQDVLRTMKPNNATTAQLSEKMRQAATLKTVLGHCMWPAYELENNAHHINDSLKSVYFKYQVLMPSINVFDQKPPKPVLNLRLETKSTLIWDIENTTSEMDKQARFVVYRFAENTKVDLENPVHIIGITSKNTFTLPSWCKGNQTLVVTALDRCWNESEPKTIHSTR